MTASIKRIYLDYNATAPLRQVARESMLELLDAPGNASSVHGEGRRAHQSIEIARVRVARLCGAEPSAVTFTSGGTEANHLALTPDISVGGKPRRASRLFVSAVEHASVLEGGRFTADQVQSIGVDGHGRIQVDALAAALAAENDAGGVSMVSVMVANNETGTLQPVMEIAEVARRAGAYFHADAVQAAGKIDLDRQPIPADFITLSAHKIGGAQGCGALVRYSGAIRPAPLLHGGAQENRLRAGTQNVAAIAAFGAAAEAARDEPAVLGAVARLRDQLESELKRLDCGAVIFAEAVERLPNTSCFALPGVAAETAVIALDLAGIAVSSGSACSSGKVGASHVLSAMGVEPALARGALRVSLGLETGADEIDALIAALRPLVGRKIG
jgi:cysteine desulfurase